MKVVVLCSGGLDSTVLLHHAVHLYGKKTVIGISFDYGSKHNSKEIECAIWQCKKLGVDHKLFHLQTIEEHFKSTILKGGGTIPYGHYAEKNMEKTVVPQRNGIMLLLAAGFLESIGGGKVWIASHSGDHFIYKDCRPEYNRIINMLIEYGSGNKVSISAPFNKMIKTDIVKRGQELNVDWSKTWSCYEGKSRPCLKCATCLERAISFRDAQVKDTLLMEEEWKQVLKNVKGMK